jgi:hypothetical protein
MMFAILWSGLIALVEQASFVEVLYPRGVIMGLIFGLIAGLFLRGKIATIEVVGEKRSFVSRVNIVLWRLGYQPATQAEDLFTYRPGLELLGSSGRIGVQLRDEDRAEIFGPKLQVEKVIRALAEG